MDKQNNTPENQDWIDEILGAVETASEIGPDEQAVSAAGLTHPDDLELEKILSEDWSQIPDPEDGTQQIPAPEAPAGVPAEAPAEAAEEAAPAVIPQPEEAPAPDATQPFTPAPEAPAGQETGDTPAEVTPRKRKPAPERKRRPRWKQGYGLLGIPHILATCIWLAIIVAIGVALGRTLWVCCADLMAFGKEDQQVTITIAETDDLDAICKKLADAELIRYPSLFKLFAELTDKDENISAGTHTLNSKYDYNAMINAMGSYSSPQDEVEVMVPEGYNCAQIFALLEEKGVCSAADLEAYAADGELDDYWFLEGVTRGTPYCLEGYLFPDTYKFYTNDDPRRVLEKFLDDFDYRFTDKMESNFAEMQQRWADMLASNGYGQTYISEHPLTLHQVITLASIVEEETGNNTESFTIASVFYNRLASPNFPRLDSDATVYYAIGAYFEHSELTAADLDSDSPYNTRKANGLPPGPISNPGLYSIYAALDPDDTSYYFFIYDASIGGHRFSRTIEEHNRWAAQLG